MQQILGEGRLALDKERNFWDLEKGKRLRPSGVLKDIPHFDMDTILATVINKAGKEGQLSMSANFKEFEKVNPQFELRSEDVVNFTLFHKNTNRIAGHLRTEDRNGEKWIASVNFPLGEASTSNLNFNVFATSGGSLFLNIVAWDISDAKGSKIISDNVV